MTSPTAEPRDTPYLEVDHGILTRNLDRAATDAAAHGLTLRPHAKTHKSPDIGRLQLDRGATGLTLATVSEAEHFADNGFTDIFIAYPVWPSPGRARRIRDLAERVTLRLGVDSADTAARLGAALAPGSVDVLVEIDSGHHRSGVDPREAGDIAVAAARAGLRVLGVFTFPGHSYTPGAREGAARDEATAVTIAAESLETHGIDPVVRSGGSTPSRAVSDGTVLTEARPGVYVFNDAQQVELGSCALSDVALTARTTVVSRRGRDIIVDAGSKTLGADRPAWATGYGRVLEHPEARITALSEHHATVNIPDGDELPDLGSQLRIVPNHVCNTVNLADELIIVRGGTVVDEWPVTARGANT